MIHYIIPSTTSPAMKSPCFKVKLISYEMNINENKANLRDLIATTGLIILLKLDSNRRFFARVTLKFDG